MNNYTINYNRRQLVMFFKLKYMYMNIMETDRVLELIYADTETVTSGGVRTESSMPIHYILLAEDLANHFITGEELDSFANCLFGVYNKIPSVKEIMNSYKDSSKADTGSDKKAISLKMVTVSSSAYNEALNLLESNKRAFLDERIEADKYRLVFKNNKIIGGFGLCKTGYLTGFFSLEKGLGRTIFEIRLQEAKGYANEHATEYSLFCTGDFLRNLYQEFGFKVATTFEWCDEYTTENWDYERYGRPNLYSMSKKI